MDPAIHRVRLETLTIFEITEAELESLERGSPESLYLNLAVSVVSIAVSFSIALATTHIESIKTYCFFVIVTVVGYLAAITFSLLWWQSRRSLTKVAQEIRKRRAPEGIQEAADGPGQSP
ncbi:MAG: hypothetical protein KY475_01700 [Planctomycetes bacterium]|nr:hypothetical protein [Planctomycetota bacterium]